MTRHTTVAHEVHIERCAVRDDEPTGTRGGADVWCSCGWHDGDHQNADWALDAAMRHRKDNPA